MCCRLRLDVSELRRRGGGLFGANPLTGSIGVVTINLPRLGYLATDDADLLQRLARLMDLARDSLEIKRKVLEALTDQGLYPYSSFYLRQVKQRFDRHWHNHFATIGLVGMNEACLNLLGCDIGSPESRAFAGRILDFMRDRLTAYQAQTGNSYNLEATPAEGTAHRLARLDARRYPHIRRAGTGDDDTAAPFYTNSSQLPVNYTVDPFEALALQDDLQCRYTGGTVLHVFLGEAAPDPDAAKTFIRTVCQRFRLPYFTLTPTFSVCADHGYLNGEQPACPRCEKPTEVYSRVVGYLRPVAQWNAGKQAEFAARRAYRLGAG